MSIIRDIKLAAEGHRRIAWVARHMPVLNAIGARFEKERPLDGLRIALSVHLEAKTAYLAKTLRRAGAVVAVTGSNPGSTQDSICAALVEDGLSVFAIHGASMDEYTDLWSEALAIRPHLIVDDGAELMHLLLGKCAGYAEYLIGGCEETTSGLQRLRGWEAAGKLAYPAIAINDARCKCWFDNTYGTGQTVWDAIMRTTNLQIGGKVAVVAGYGYCGRGIASIARGLGAQVVVCEVDPVNALLAVTDGYRAMRMDDAAKIGDIFVTATACCDVIRAEHFAVMKDNAIVANAGHFSHELDLDGLRAMAQERSELRHNLTGYLLKSGKTVCVIADGNICNISAADGHPVEIMDLSFSLQALGTEYLAKHAGTLRPGVMKLPDELDRAVGALKLQSLGGDCDTLSDRQRAYIQTY